MDETKDLIHKGNLYIFEMGDRVKTSECKLRKNILPRDNDMKFLA